MAIGWLEIRPDLSYKITLRHDICALSSMDRVSAYEAVDEGSTPPGHTIKDTNSNLFLPEGKMGILIIEYWGVVECKHNGPHKDFGNYLNSERVSKTVELVSCRFKSYLPCQ